MRGRQRPASPSGFHLLQSRVAAEIVRAARVAPGELVFDLGAGLGALTAPLAARAAHVVAVERSPEYAQALRRRLPAVTVVCDDLRTVPLPRRDFRVVANIPFATTSALLHRLAGTPSLVRADLVVEYGAARRFASGGRDAVSLWLASRYETRVARRLPPSCFSPPPRVDAAVLVLVRAELSGPSERLLRTVVAHVARTPGQTARALARSLPRAVNLPAAGIDPREPVGGVSPERWRMLVMG